MNRATVLTEDNRLVRSANIGIEMKLVRIMEDTSTNDVHIAGERLPTRADKVWAGDSVG